jgi:proteic killer suppression protein
MIQSFYDQGTEDIYNRRDTKAARKTCPKQIWRVAQRKLDQLNAAVTLSSLGLPPSNRLEPLSKDRRGQHSIRINDQYRVCFVWTDEGPEKVEVTDYH